MKLTTSQINEFQTQGVLVVESVLTHTDLNPVIEEINEFISARARQFLQEGKIQNLYENEPFEQRFALLYEQSQEINKNMDITEIQGERTFEFLRNKNLLDVVENLIGGEIICSPIQHLRAKFPQSLAKKNPNFFYGVPWHQDASVTWEEADPSEIITFWIPLADATLDTGCMDVIPGIFNKGLLLHGPTSFGPSIKDDQVPQLTPRPVPCHKGGMVIMHKYTPHRSGPNTSNRVRWSLDLRYQKTGTPTGRPFYPEIVVRSLSQPETVLTDHARWCQLWNEAIEKSKGIPIHRVQKY